MPFEIIRHIPPLLQGFGLQTLLTGVVVVVITDVAISKVD